MNLHNFKMDFIYWPEVKLISFPGIDFLENEYFGLSGECTTFRSWNGLHLSEALPFLNFLENEYFDLSGECNTFGS